MRIRQLDILRAVAIFLVLGRHKLVSQVWYRAGWVGVDLFFVLSGFLIAGLLFTEFKRFKRIDRLTFFIRRGLKIYPAFYVLFLATMAVALYQRDDIQASKVLSELFFVQNYGPPIWNHTWSLAVEEHFYLLLPFALALMINRSRSIDDPFQKLPVLFAIVAMLCLGLRIATSLLLPYKTATHLDPTHLRIDSLLFGVLIAYFYHFKGDELRAWVRTWSGWILLASCALIAPCVFVNVKHSFFLHTLGLSFLYVGFGGVMLVVLMTEPAVPAALKKLTAPLAAAIAFVGVHSYSIYLWHMPVANWAIPRLRAVYGHPINYVVEFLLYAAGSIAAGFIMARIVELPVLKLRDRIFPPRNGDLYQPPASRNA